MIGENLQDIGLWWIGGRANGSACRPSQSEGGRIVGVVPQFVVDRNMVSDKLDVEIRTVGLADRKTVMMERSDILVALPEGGRDA